MKIPGKIAFAALLFFSLLLPACRGLRLAARGVWQRDDTTIAWRAGTNVVWRFSFDPKKGKPFFHPLSVVGSPSLTDFKPEDHPWHYGLWFSWKYIDPVNSTNHVNYWEEDCITGQAQGKTLWKTPSIKTAPDGSATIRLDLSYVNPAHHLDMTEKRELTVSAPEADGAYTITWRAHFVVGDKAVVLERTAMPGEPGGQINGGYAGLAFRMAGPPLTVSMLCATGLVTKFETDRARPAASAAAFNFLEGAKVVGGVAILTPAPKTDEKSPWYLVNSPAYRFACAAILAPKPLTLPAHGEKYLAYLISIRPEAWTVDALQSEQARWAGRMNK